MAVGTPPTLQDMIDAVNCAIQAILVGGAVSSYTIAGRTLSRVSMADLVSLRDGLKKEKTVPGGNRLFVRFTEPA